MEYAIVDLETTGLSPIHDRIIEVALVVTDTEGEPLEQYHTLVNPSRDPGPSEIHRLHLLHLVNAPDFAEIAGRLADLLRDRLLIAFNASFDAHFLVREFERARLGSPVFSMFCLKEESKSVVEAPARDLTSLCQAIGYAPLHRHHALEDVAAARQLLVHCLGRCPKFRWRLERTYRHSFWPPSSRQGRALPRLSSPAGQQGPSPKSSQTEPVGRPFKKAEDLVRLVHILSSPPRRTVKELSATLGKSRRTVYRYIESLEEMGLPLYEENNRYGLLESGYLPPLDLDLRETLAVYLGLAVAEKRLGELSPAIRSAFGKLRKRLSFHDELEPLSDRVLAPVRGLDAGSSLEALSGAISQSREVSFQYRPLASEERVRRVWPRSLFLFDEAWYLWAWDPEKEDNRRFRLSRLRDLRVLKATFQLSPPGVPAYHRWDATQGEPVRIVLRVTTSLAEWLSENPPHPSLKLGPGICYFEVRSPEAMVPFS